MTGLRFGGSGPRRRTLVGPSAAEAHGHERPIPRADQAAGRDVIPRRELVTLLAYLETGSHKAAAHRLAISESTSRQRVSQLMGRVGARTAAEAVWKLRQELEAEAGTAR